MTLGQVQIRSAAPDDVSALTALYNHYIEHTPATFDLEPWTVERRRVEWFDNYAPTGPHRILVAEEASGRIVGMTYSGPWHRKAAYASSVETSVYCLAGETGRGLGRALYSALFTALEAEPLNRAFALITLPNDASEALHRRMGFESVGVLPEAGRKFDRFWDVAVWQRPLARACSDGSNLSTD